MASNAFDLSMISQRSPLLSMDLDAATMRQAALVVCDHARDVDDARLLLAMLGLIETPIVSDAL